MEKSIEFMDKKDLGMLPMLSREELYGFGIIDLSEMIMSIEQTSIPTPRNPSR